MAVHPTTSRAIHPMSGSGRSPYLQGFFLAVDSFSQSGNLEDRQAQVATAFLEPTCKSPGPLAHW